MQTKEHGFQARSAAEWVRLRRAQAELEEETGNAAFLGASLADTLRQCVKTGNHRAAARLRADFKVSDRRFWWLKVGSRLNFLSAVPMQKPFMWKYMCVVCGVRGSRVPGVKTQSACTFCATKRQVYMASQCNQG